jgi:hypothetical protein
LNIDATIQINLEIPNDSLFSPYSNGSGIAGQDSALWPVFTLKRSIHMDDAKIQDIFGLFMTVTNNKVWFYVGVITFAVLSLVAAFVFWWCMRRKISKMDSEDHYMKMGGEENISDFDSKKDETDIDAMPKYGAKGLKPTDSTMAPGDNVGDQAKRSMGESNL